MISRDRAMRRHVVIDPASNKNNSFGRNAGFGIRASDARATRNREASMNRRLAGMVVTMGVGVSALVGIASAQQSTGSAALDSGLRAAVERKDVPGVGALVTDRDRGLYQGAFGVADVATGRPLAADALFRIASMTKPVTSVALMQLIEQGKLTLDDPAEKYLPELANPQVIENFDPATGAY